MNWKKTGDSTVNMSTFLCWAEASFLSICEMKQKHSLARKNGYLRKTLLGRVTTCLNQDNLVHEEKTYRTVVFGQPSFLVSRIIFMAARMFSCCAVVSAESTRVPYEGGEQHTQHEFSYTKQSDVEVKLSLTHPGTPVQA